MDYDHLASLVGRDLTAYLTRRIPELVGPVYAVTLYVEDYYGVGIATEAEFQRRASAPYYQQVPEVLHGPAGLRWRSGEWDIPADPFLTEETEEALAPLTRPMRDVELDVPDELVCAALHRYEEVAHRALERATPLPMLPSSALVWVELADSDEAVPRTESMLRTNPTDRLRETFPEWRRLAEILPAVRADPDRVREIRERVDSGAEVRRDQPSPDELTALLRSCGLGPGIVLTDDHDELYRVLKLANRLS